MVRRILLHEIFFLGLVLKHPKQHLPLYLYCHILINEELESQTTEKIEASLAKSLAFEVSPAGKLLI